MPAQKPCPTVKYLLECLEYNPETGALIWKARPDSHFKSPQAARQWNSRFSGKEAGCVVQHDRLQHYHYKKLRVAERVLRAHRICWAMFYGEWPSPEMQIDHQNGNALDNRIANLRLATCQENNCNRRREIRNTSGVTGVTWDSRRNKWMAHIKINRCQRHLGRFDNFEDAVAARKRAEIDLKFHPNHDNHSTRTIGSACID